MTDTLRRTLSELARRADLAASTQGTGRAYRFSATATPTVVLALVQAVDAVQQLCDGNEAPVTPQALQRVIDNALATLTVEPALAV